MRIDFNNRPTVGLACRRDATTSALAAIDAASMELAWVVHSFDSVDDAFEKSAPAVMLISSPSSLPAFWRFLQQVTETAPRPTVAVFGPTAARDVFRFAAAGVDHYFESLVVAELMELGTGRRSSEALLRAAARRSVGDVGVKEAQRLVRSEMFRTALDRTNGNRHATARALGVDRSYVRKMLSEQPELDRAGPTSAQTPPDGDRHATRARREIAVACPASITDAREELSHGIHVERRLSVRERALPHRR